MKSAPRSESLGRRPLLKQWSFPRKRIQPVGGGFPVDCGVDSRFRGNDCTWERPCLANETTTPALDSLDTQRHTGIHQVPSRSRRPRRSRSPRMAGGGVHLRPGAEMNPDHAFLVDLYDLPMTAAYFERRMVWRGTF